MGKIKVYNNLDEVMTDVVDGILVVNCDVTFNFNLDAEIDINAQDIKARGINARGINARGIKAQDIKARGINARGISYHAVCFAYRNIRCKSIQGRRENARHFALDGEVIQEGKHGQD